MKEIKPSRKDRSRNQILDAAKIAFSKHDLDGVSMEDLAERAGLTRTTLYNFFASKEDIALAVAQRETEVYDSAFRARIADGDEAVGMLGDLLLEIADVCCRHPKVALVSLTRLPSDASELKAAPSGASTRGLICDILALGQVQGAIRRDQDPWHLTFVALGLFTQMMLHTLSTGGALSRNEIDWLVRLTLEGIGARETK